MEFNIEFLAIVITPIVLGLAYLLIRQAFQFYRENPNAAINVPAIIEPYIREAIMWAANFVEELDRTGELAKFIDQYADKGEQKLNLAVDYAVEYFETRVNEFLSRFGVPHVDIPETLIKDMIQRYVWENPNLFPSVGSNMESQSLNYPTGKHARLQPANYPANQYKETKSNVESNSSVSE